MDMESSPCIQSARRPCFRKESLCPLQDKRPLVRHCSDRFIPDRASVNWEIARFKLFHKEKEQDASACSPSPAKKAYKMELAATLLKDANAANADSNCRILSFRRKPEPINDGME